MSDNKLGWNRNLIETRIHDSTPCTHAQTTPHMQPPSSLRRKTPCSLITWVKWAYMQIHLRESMIGYHLHIKHTTSDCYLKQLSLPCLSHQQCILEHRRLQSLSPVVFIGFAVPPPPRHCCINELLRSIWALFSFNPALGHLMRGKYCNAPSTIINMLLIFV